jgi:hypothetical protein
MKLEPEPSNGSQSVLLRATGDDSNTGRNNVVSASYTIDGGPPAALALDRIDNPVTGMTATLAIETVGVLAEGQHLIEITAVDELGNLGVPGIITLTIDLTGPTVSAVGLATDTLDLSGAPQVTSVRLDATIADDLSNGAQSLLANAEGFIDTVGPDGSGFDLFPTDGLFDEFTEGAYFDIPISAFLYRSQGPHLVCVHGLDSAGNWGVVDTGTDCATITIDRGVQDAVGPDIVALNVTLGQPDRALLATTAVPATVEATASDPLLLSNIVGAEWFVDTDPGEGNGFALNAADGTFDMPNETLVAQIDVGPWINGDHTLFVRALDGSGFWGEAASVRIGQNKVYLPLVLRDH